MRKKVLIASIFLFVMLIFPTTSITTASEVNNDIENESPSEENNPVIFENCIMYIAGQDRIHEHYLEHDKTTGEVNFRLGHTYINLFHFSPFGYYHSGDKDTTAKIEGFRGITHLKIQMGTTHRIWFIVGFASRVEFTI